MIVYDVLVNQSSEIINTYSWNLGEVLPKEEINIDYTIKIGDEVSSGTYTNLAQAFGFDGQGIEVNSNKASTTIEIITEFSTSTDVDSQLKDMQEKLIKVKEEIKRIMTTEPEAEGSNQNPVEAIAEILIPEASAQEENRFSLLPLPWLKLIEEGELNESIEKLLAGAGIILANSKRINIVNIFSVLPLLIIFLLSLNKKEEEKDEKENQ